MQPCCLVTAAQKYKRKVMTSNARLNADTMQSTELTSVVNNNNNNNNDNNNKNTIIRRPYHSWQGNNTILCDGRVIGGPQKQNFIYTLILILVPSISFTCFVCRNYIIEYSSYYVLIIYIILLIISLISFGLTAFSDPGIIPRGILGSNNIIYKGPIHLKQRLCISGKLIEIKWCGTCHVFRPPRSFHCYICNNCVERFDHHCPWIGNCIGIRNYAFFSIFVNSLQLVCFWALSHCIYILYLRAASDYVSNETSWKQFVYCLKYEYMAFITGIYVFIGMWFVIGLTWFHWFLVFVGKTTNEQLRNLHPAGSPFKRSFIGNIIDMCCKLPPSSIHLHHLSPKTSYNELYVNKSKVRLLDNDEVKKHHQQTHSMHISLNSPFKNCLINSFGYGHHKNNDKLADKRTHLNGLLNKSMEYAEMIDIENGNNINNMNNNNNNNNNNAMYKNGKNGYSSHVQMSGTNGYHQNENDGKIEEEDENEENGNEQIIEEKEEKTQIITIKQIDLNEKKNINNNNSNNEEYKEDGEEEENKYDDINDDNSSETNSKSKSRKDDENDDAEHLYTSYDDEDDVDMNQLNQPQFQYSRSVTPDVSSLTDNNNNNHIPSIPPEPMLNTTNSSNLGMKISNTSTGKRNDRTCSNASKASVPSESPGSDYAAKHLTDFQ